MHILLVCMPSRRGPFSLNPLRRKFVASNTQGVRRLFAKLHYSRELWSFHMAHFCLVLRNLSNLMQGLCSKWNISQPHPRWFSRLQQAHCFFYNSGNCNFRTTTKCLFILISFAHFGPLQHKYSSLSLQSMQSLCIGDLVTKFSCLGRDGVFGKNAGDLWHCGNPLILGKRIIRVLLGWKMAFGEVFVSLWIVVIALS